MDFRLPERDKNATPSPDDVIAILNQTVQDQEDAIPTDREVSVISSTPNHYHFITKHETDTRLIYTNVYFMDKKIGKPSLRRSGMVFLESTLLKLLDLYKRSSDIFRSEMEESLEPISCDKRLTVDISMDNVLGAFSIHSFFDFNNEQLDIKKLKIDKDEPEEVPDREAEMFIQIDSEENYVVDPEDKALCFRKKIFITARNSS
ncbi:MAG: hypothetical protein JW889_04165 [Verrucomicrobia bacterium]|nr:hypothetical protein [Verrucomicrobiota bacterium]